LERERGRVESSWKSASEINKGRKDRAKRKEMKGTLKLGKGKENGGNF